MVTSVSSIPLTNNQTASIFAPSTPSVLQKTLKAQARFHCLLGS